MDIKAQLTIIVKRGTPDDVRDRAAKDLLALLQHNAMVKDKRPRVSARQAAALLRLGRIKGAKETNELYSKLRVWLNVWHDADADEMGPNVLVTVKENRYGHWEVDPWRDDIRLHIVQDVRDLKRAGYDVRVPHIDDSLLYLQGDAEKESFLAGLSDSRATSLKKDLEGGWGVKVHYPLYLLRGEAGCRMYPE